MWSLGSKHISQHMLSFRPFHDHLFPWAIGQLMVHLLIGIWSFGLDLIHCKFPTHPGYHGEPMGNSESASCYETAEDQN